MKVSGAGKLRTPRGPRVALAALACWTAGVLIFAALPEDSAWRVVWANAVHRAAAAFALIFLARAAWGVRGRERLFWGLLAAGSLAGIVGDASRAGLQGFAAQDLSYRHAAYLAPYLLFICALMLLVSSVTRGITFITLLDSLCILLSVGILGSYFFMDPRAVEPGFSWVFLSLPSLDVALLFLCLVVYTTTTRPPFAGFLAAGFLVFALADGWYLENLSYGSFTLAGWPYLLRALGFVLIGLAALRVAPINAKEQRMGSWRVFFFWLGPISPPIQLGIALAWGAVHPPLPAYVLAGTAILLLYLALRIALVSFATRRLNREQEETTRRLEQGRVLYEMHDTVKQSVHGISLTLRAALEAARRSEHDATRRMLDRALEASQEAEYRVSEPYDELQAIDAEVSSNPSEYLRHRLKKFEEYFGVETHEDFRIPFEFLSPEEVAAAQRVFIEASWNAVKHSGARNLWLETRRVGPVVIVRTRDDGHGFDTSDPPPGLGLRYMRRRAGEVGAELDVISFPGRGTTIQLRFDKKE